MPFQTLLTLKSFKEKSFFNKLLGCFYWRCLRQFTWVGRVKRLEQLELVAL
jgi:hypothetical protein